MANSENDQMAGDETIDVEQYPQGRDTSFQGPAGELGGDHELGATDVLGETPFGRDDAAGESAETGGIDSPGSGEQ